MIRLRSQQMERKTSDFGLGSECYLHPFRVTNSAHLKKGQGNADCNFSLRCNGI